MTDTPTPAKTIQLKGEQWKTLALLHVQQLSQYLQNIPGSVETGAAGLSDQHLGMIDVHIQEMALILGAWRRSRGPVAPQPQPAAPVQVEAHDPAGGGQTGPMTMGNGAATPKGRGGWPKGRKRTRQAPQPAVTQ